MRLIRIIALSSLIPLAATATATATATTAADGCAPLHRAIEPMMRHWLVRGSRDGAHRTVGTALGFYLDGRECYFGYGHTRLKGGHVPTRHTLFEIGSVTKTFTATMLALHEVRNPAFSPQSPVNVSGIPCAGDHCLHLANGMDQLTYFELATFTGSLPDDPTNLHGIGMRRYTQADFIAYLDGLAAPPAGLPAPDSYSNSSYGFLGQLLMALDGYHDFNDPVAFRTDFDHWIERAITAPLGMACTAADVAALPPTCNAKAELATGYSHTRGRYVRVREPWPWVPWGPAGALRSNAQDLVRYVSAYLGAHSVEGNAVPGDLAAAMKRARSPTWVKLKKRPAHRQAYAWVVMPADDPRFTAVIKNGGTAGFSACIILMPGASAGVVLLANTAHANPCSKARTVLRRAVSVVAGEAAG